MNLFCDLREVFKPSLAKEVNLDFCAWNKYHVHCGKSTSIQIVFLLCCCCFLLLKPIWWFWPELSMVMMWRHCIVWPRTNLLKISLTYCVWNCIDVGLRYWRFCLQRKAMLLGSIIAKTNYPSQKVWAEYGDTLKYMQLNGHILKCKYVSAIDTETFWTLRCERLNVL